MSNPPDDDRGLSADHGEGGADDPSPRVPSESEWQLAEEQALAERRVSSIEAGRRKGGVAGAAMAGAMLALQEIYEGPPKDDGAVVTEAPGKPGDIDADGITVEVGDVEVHAALPDTDNSD